MSISLLLILFNPNQQTNGEFHRDYTLIYATGYDLMNSAVNLNTAGKMVYDAWFRGIAPKITNNTIRNSVGTGWMILTRWALLLFPHELGHWLRARQVGGNFGFERFAFPGIIGWMKLPEDSPIEHHILALIGGLETDALTAREIQENLFYRGGLFNDEYGLAFGHRLMYPLYALFTLPANPRNPEFWKNVGGDPATFVKLIWERSEQLVFLHDSSVNPGLIKFYYWSTILSALWNLSDLNFYSSAASFFGPELGGRNARFLIGDNENGWSYGTLYNPSVLGAELYLLNYLRIKGRFYTGYLRYSFPLNGIGAGIAAPEIISTERLSLGLTADFWQQQFYGRGGALSATINFNLTRNWQITATAGWKTPGYIIGKTTAPGFTATTGLSYIRH